MKIQLDMYQTLAAAVLVLLLGNYLKKKIYFLQMTHCARSAWYSSLHL